MRKRKKGSTLITVLALSIVFMALGGAILTAIMGTMKSNTNQKIREDLKYAAESGLEIARSYLKGKSTITQVDIDEMNKKMNEVLVDINVDGVPDDNIGSVKLISPMISNGNLVNGKEKNDTSKINVKVRAEKTGNINIYETIGVNYKLSSGGNGSIFDYGVVSGSGGITIDTQHGTVDLGATNIAGPNGGINLPNHGVKPGSQVEKDFGEVAFENMEYKEQIIAGKLDGNNEINGIRYENLEEKSDQYMIKDFKLYDTLTKKQLKFNKIKLNLTSGKIYFDGEETSLSNLINKNKDAIVEIEIVKISENIEKSIMKLTNINSKKLDMELERQNFDLTYHSLICKGELNVRGVGTMTIKYSTIFANKIYISKDSALHVTYQAAQIPNLVGHGILNDDEEKKLNEVMSGLIFNWNVEEGFGGANLNFIGEFTN